MQRERMTMLGGLKPVRPVRETALFFRTVDELITNFDVEIGQQLSDFYTGNLSEEKLTELQLFSLVGPCHLRTETKAW